MSKDPDSDLNPAACNTKHARAGLVCNQNPDEDYDKSEPYHAISVCSRQACIDKAISKVAGNTNRRATFYSDSERRAKRRTAQR